MRKTLLASVAIAALATLGLAAPAQAQGASWHSHRSTAEVSVLHAVPNVPVDIYVNHKLAIDDFQPGTLTDSMTVLTGRYVVSVTAATAVDDSAPIIGPVSLKLTKGKNYTLAAHLTTEGTPTATLFENDNGRIRAGYGQVTVRHIAAAPAVDVLANGVPVLTGLTNPNEEKRVARVATVSTTIALAGTTTPVLGPVDVSIEDGVNTIVYAVGSAADGTLGLSVQKVDMKVKAPSHS